MLSFNMEEISAILNDINLITKVKFDLYDKDFNILHSDNHNMCGFCSLVRTCPECHKKCQTEKDLPYPRKKHRHIPISAIWDLQRP